MSGQELEKVAMQEGSADLTQLRDLNLDRIARMGMWLAAAESNSSDPKAKGMAAALRIAWAEYLNLPPYAASEIYVIKGNVTLSSKGFRALAHKHGLRVVAVETTKDSCTAAVINERTGEELGRTTYTLAQAQQQGLSGPAWQQTPDRMLWARASKRALDDHAPWVTVGVQAPEDLDPSEVVEVLPVVDEVPFEAGD